MAGRRHLREARTYEPDTAVRVAPLIDDRAEGANFFETLLHKLAICYVLVTILVHQDA